MHTDNITNAGSPPTHDQGENGLCLGKGKQDARIIDLMGYGMSKEQARDVIVNGLRVHQGIIGGKLKAD